jgi:hypothetical protein
MIHQELMIINNHGMQSHTQELGHLGALHVADLDILMENHVMPAQRSHCCHPLKKEHCFAIKSLIQMARETPPR